MKIIALDSSPRKRGISKTRLLLDALVSGMREAGAEVEDVRLRDKKVRLCVGCFTCWSKTPGVCVHKDDMTAELLPKWSEADIAVYASPLYHYTVNAAMKAFIERTLPTLEPFMIKQGDRTHHPFRTMPPKAVVLSVAGFPDASIFGQLSSYMTFLFGKGLLAQIYRPAAEMMIQPGYSRILNEILDATSQAGREIVQSMKVSDSTMGRITQPIAHDSSALTEVVNLFWKTCIQEGVTPREFDEKKMVPRPDSIGTFLLLMSSAFNGEAAGNTRAAIQFNFTGEVPGTCHLAISDGTISAQEGSAADPDLIVESPFEVWMDIVTDKADGGQMFMQQRYSATGDISLLLQMKGWFTSAGGRHYG